MILMYHKIDIITPSRWWVSVNRFEEQLKSLENFSFVYLDQYDPDDVSQVVITFDDAYENIYTHAFPVLKKKRLKFEVFVISNLRGDWNDFDTSEVKTRFCGQAQLEEMAEAGARIQWHTRSHRRLTRLGDEELHTELDIPQELRSSFPSPHLRWFCYPYGAHDERVVSEVRKRFSGALSVEDGAPADRYQLNRIVADQDWCWRPVPSDVSVSTVKSRDRRARKRMVASSQ
jgi:peptidoglycan/xylan/chitin deacetylase (PgdA/CDA1 family)